MGRELRARLAEGRRNGALGQETKGDAQVKVTLSEGRREGTEATVGRPSV